MKNYYFKSNDLEKPFAGPTWKLNIRMFEKINFETINLLQKATLNKNVL